MKPKVKPNLLSCDELVTITKDMRKLFNDFRAGKCDRADADSAANIAGKNLKAQQLISANTIYNDMMENRIERLLPPGDAAARLARDA